MMRHIKKFAALLLAAICTMMVLTGCVDCYTTADTTSGKFKILLVHTDNKQIVAEYIDDAYSDLVLPVGNYKVYLVGKDDAAFNVSISLYCFGENVSWYEPSKK